MIKNATRWAITFMLVACLSAAIYGILKSLGVPRDYCLLPTGWFSGALHSFITENQTP